ncbi:MAG: hypothetical protein J6N49_01065 [Alphaproteobacteria bacterium]|nr:hypothetical protein [Alphaproteobacteria bacterium]
MDYEQIRNDIEQISKEVGVAVIAYDDIHNDTINNEFHYDFERVINEVSRTQGISYEEAEAILVKDNVLKPLPGGEYEVDVGTSTRYGGGLNYGDVFFSSSSKDYHTTLHELAHSLQSEFGMFAEEKIDKLYDNAKTGLREDEYDDKLLDRGNYNLFLNEQHADCFGSAVLLLRAESAVDFYKQTLDAKNMADASIISGALSFGETNFGADENSSKFYANRPVIYALIKEIKNIRKEGRREEYFNENGTINAEKIAKLCENIVMENTYSPRTLKAFFDYNITDGHSEAEHGWRRDVLKSMTKVPRIIVSSVKDIGKAASSVRTMVNHSKLRKQQVRKMEQVASKKVPCSDPELSALKEYERIRLKLDILDMKMPTEYMSIKINEILPTMMKHQMLPNLVDMKVESISSGNPISRLMLKHDAKNTINEISKILAENKNNPYFAKLINSEVPADKLQSMMRNKQKNPGANVIDEARLEPRKDTGGVATYPVKSVINSIEAFSDKYNLEPAVKAELLTMVVTNSQRANYAVSQKKIAEKVDVPSGFLGMNKRKFKKELKEIMGQIGSVHYYNQDNPAYNSIKDELKKVPTNEFQDKITKMHEEELEKRARKAQEHDSGEESITQEISPTKQTQQEQVDVKQEQPKAKQQSQETAKQPEKTAQQAQPMAQTAIMQQPVQQSQPMMQQPMQQTPQAMPQPMQQTQQDNKPQVFQYTPYTMPHIIQEQPQPQPQPQVQQPTVDVVQPQIQQPMMQSAQQTMPQPQVQQPTVETVQPQIQQPTISNEQSAQYDQFVATNADAKLRAACSDMMNREPEKYTKIVSDWTAQYNADPLHPENAVNNVLATYKQDLMPYVESAIKREKTQTLSQTQSLQGQTYDTMSKGDKYNFVKALRQGDNLISGEGFKAATARAPTNPQQTKNFARQTMLYNQQSGYVR